MTSSRWLPLLAAVALAGPRALGAQEVATGYDPHRVQVSRDDLHLMLQRLDQAAGSSTYSKPVREKASAEAELIRQRLTQGDFQIGDRIVLVVEGEAALTDTFTVLEPRVLRLPVVGDVSMTGVLRSELEGHLRASLAKYLRDPVVRARSLIRLALLGQVAKPGYYVVPSHFVLTDALMVAGGPIPTAKVEKVRIERNGEAIWEAEALQAALAEGRTLDQLNLRAGDQVVVPRNSSVFWSRAIPVMLALPATIWAIVSIADSNDN